jgi:hypothetical protein
MRTWIKIVLVLFLLGVISALLVYHFVINKPHPDYEKMKADYTITAKDLYSQFAADKKEAGLKYNGKVLEISGKFKSIEKNDTLAVVVFSFKEGMFGDEGIRCTLLSKFTDKTKELINGTEVRIKGYCSGFNDTDVILEKCSLPSD